MVKTKIYDLISAAENYAGAIEQYTRFEYGNFAACDRAEAYRFYKAQEQRWNEAKRQAIDAAQEIGG